MLTPLKVAFIIASSVGVLTAASVSRAAPMDPTPERFSLSPPGTAPGTQCTTVCVPNNISWANMMTELGYAIAPSAFHAARTTGIGGFALSFEATYAHINADEYSTATNGQKVQYWHEGTQGAVSSASQIPGYPVGTQYSIRNNSPDSILQIYSLKARKGLPFGFEITGALGYLANTSLWVGGADVHWAPLEGYRTGILGYLPDLAVGGGVRTLGGSPKLFLTTVGLDAQLSKPITLGDSAVLTPYIGGQRLWIFADSTIVSLTPNVDPIGNQCGYKGNNVPGNMNAPGNSSGNYDGQPICSQPGGSRRSTTSPSSTMRASSASAGSPVCRTGTRSCTSPGSSPWTSRTRVPKASRRRTASLAASSGRPPSKSACSSREPSLPWSCSSGVIVYVVVRVRVRVRVRERH